MKSRTELTETITVTIPSHLSSGGFLAQPTTITHDVPSLFGDGWDAVTPSMSPTRGYASVRGWKVTDVAFILYYMEMSGRVEETIHKWDRTGVSDRLRARVESCDPTTPVLAAFDMPLSRSDSSMLGANGWNIRLHGVNGLGDEADFPHSFTSYEEPVPTLLTRLAKR